MNVRFKRKITDTVTTVFYFIIWLPFMLLIIIAVKLGYRDNDP